MVNNGSVLAKSIITILMKLVSSPFEGGFSGS